MAADEHDKAGDGAALHRRNRMAGLWAAELLGLINEAAHDYARELVHGAHEAEAAAPPDAGGAPQGEDTLVHRLARDLHGRATIQEIRAKLSHFLHEAKRQIFHEQGGDRG